MRRYLDELALQQRAQLEAEFGSHAVEVLQSGCMPQLQLATQQTSAARAGGWRPEYGDPEAYLQSVYNCIQQ